MHKNSGEISFDSFDCPTNILVTARSHLVDRFVPECEIIHLPPKKTVGGKITFAKKETRALPAQQPRRRFPLLSPQTTPEKIEGKTFIDFRLHTPQNWAHFLNNHLPVLFTLAEKTGLSPDAVVLVLPANSPKHILHAANLFQLQTLCTDAPVQGVAITFESTPWTGIRSVRADKARLPYPRRMLDAAGIRDGAQGDLPKRAFISRRNTRNLENEDVVEAFLARDGYTKIYPEDLSAADQFKLFEQAERIVAIHGAAIAPLLYISENSYLTSLIELFPCGHMTDVYRVMSHQVGCDWIGVRGKIKPEHVQLAYDLETPFLKYSLQSFEVDLKSLSIAMELI